MLFKDPRLADPLLLALAAKMAAARREAAPPVDWEHSVGISSLLDAARRLPQRAPWDVLDEEEGGSMGRLLAEAKRYIEEQAHGAA